MNKSKLTTFLAQANKDSRIHGIEHWERVELFGRMLADESFMQNADIDVITWFAYLHDCMRENDFDDPQHGPRAAEYIDTIRTSYLSELNDEQIAKLKRACALHTSTHRTGDITIDTCFDADRLDLPRVGIKPQPELMATKAGYNRAIKAYDANRADASRFYDSRLNDIGKGLIFHDEYVNTSKVSKFGVRANLTNEQGEMFSPFFSNGRPWEKKAKSVEKVMPADGAIVGHCSAISLVDYDYFKRRKSILNLRSQNVVYLLVEYSPDSVIMQDETEIAVSQMNIVHVEKGNKFLDEMEDGTMEKIMSDFISAKQSMPERSFAAPITRIGKKLMKFHIENGVNYTLALRSTYFGSVLVSTIGEGDLVMLQWFLEMKSCGKLHSLTDQHVLSFLLSVRQTYLCDLNPMQFHRLYCLVTKANLPHTDIEADIYYDALYLGYHAITGEDVEDQLKVDMSHRLYRDTIFTKK